MVKDQINVHELYTSLDKTTSEFIKLVSSFNEQQINTIPFPGSWSAAQLAEHITLSNKGIAKHLSKPGHMALREPDASVDQLKSVFLNFDKKLNAPEFIVPTKEQYERESVIAELTSSVTSVEREAEKQDPFEIVPHPIFGEITRLETLHFVLYHMQRHTHQLKKIQNIVQNSASPE